MIVGSFREVSSTFLFSFDIGMMYFGGIGGAFVNVQLYLLLFALLYYGKTLALVCHHLLS
jgi:hypothetical protein